MKATIPMLIVSTAVIVLAPQGMSQQLDRPRVSPRLPVDVSVEGLGEATRGAPGDTAPAGGIGLLASPVTGSALPLDCLESIADQATGNCLTASSTPTLGMLYPYPGIGNKVAATAVVGGGEDNHATGPWSIVGGGENNQATGEWSTVGGGRQNVASGYNSGGVSQGYATIGGGRSNTVSGDFGTVAGGLSNMASGSNAAVGGGALNTASGPSTTVAGGVTNTASLAFATVGGGAGNTASGRGSTVGGGERNWASFHEATVGGGDGNIASGRTATIGGGENNIASGAWATIAGGGGYTSLSGNFASGDYGAVGGGSGNTASGTRATVPGGHLNTSRGDYSFAAGRRAQANHAGAFVWGDAQNVDKPSSGADQFNVYCRGGARFFSNSTFTAGVLLAPGGGSWSSVSDRDSKENIEPVNRRAVLEKLASLPLATWNYDAQDDSIRHMGPMAQDFYATFGLGLGERTIDTIDANGVALAAIQGLNAELEELRAEKDAEIGELRAKMAALEAQVSGLVRYLEERTGTR